MDRRTIMKGAIHAIGLAIATAIGVPSLITAFAPLRTRRPKEIIWQSIGAIDDFPVGQMRDMVISLPKEEWGEALRQRTLYAWRPSTQEVIVYSRSCTDLGCPLTFDSGSECFYCPCHGGIFDKNGMRMAGPPSRPMYRYTSRIIDRELMIDLHSVPLMA